MNKIILSDKEEMDPALIRLQFDEILVREVTSLIEIDSDIAMLTYNLSTISTIIIAVEREREIRITPNVPSERFTFDSLVNELVDLGLYKDDDMLKSVRSVLEQGYLSQNSKGELKAEASAYTIVGFLDKMFPGMQGIQLIAFVMQMIDEVLTERKTLEYAMNSFAMTLKNSGVAVTREKAEKKAQELALDNSASSKMREVALKLKEANIKRLAQQRFKQKLALNKAGGKPSFHFDGGSQLDKVKITSVFEQGPSEEEIEAEKKTKEEAQKREREEAERQYQEAILKAAQIEEQKRRLKEAEEASVRELERKAAELAAKEQALRDAEIAALKLEQQQAELRAKEAQMAAREAELKLREEQLKSAAIREEQLKANAQKEAENKNIADKQDKVAETKNISDDDIESRISGISDDIESRIAAFEAELTIPCPLCKNGIIKKEKTETGKDYFICSDKSCRFVSWSQPYPFQCPLCKNSFLVEFQNPDGTKGLKCPRASCSFSQNHLGDPAIAYNPPPQAVIAPPQQHQTGYPQQ
ncbi:MAG: hypothetical protein HQK73_03450, partial [Desulfamplus sp.]|nr:hypothetical protein [Desulfamplus sp.]